MSKLYPWAEAASAYQIDYQKEYDNGVRGVLFDVDNTLVRHGEPATKQAKELFEHLRSIGLKTCIISNNKEPRVRLRRKLEVTIFIKQGSHQYAVMRTL